MVEPLPLRGKKLELKDVFRRFTIKVTNRLHSKFMNLQHCKVALNILFNYNVTIQFNTRGGGGGGKGDASLNKPHMS